MNNKIKNLTYDEVLKTIKIKNTEFFAGRQKWKDDLDDLTVIIYSHFHNKAVMALHKGKGNNFFDVIFQYTPTKADLKANVY